MSPAAARASCLSHQSFAYRTASVWYHCPLRKPDACAAVKFRSASSLVIPLNMSKPIRSTKKSRGRPKATATVVHVGVRWQSSELEAIDAWRRGQDSSPSRTEAIRRLVNIGLGSALPTRPRSPEAASTASQLAAEQVEKMLNPLLSDEERRSRRRRLIRGPEEFRKLRKGRSGRKR
jgi:hypothetical protein